MNDRTLIKDPAPRAGPSPDPTDNTELAIVLRREEILELQRRRQVRQNEEAVARVLHRLD